MEYNFKEIEQNWQKYWADHKTFAAENDSTKPKYYALDMFPYPSGAGLHVGHPLGYIASDIVSRYKRLKGFNVLHPMGYDSFGLPAEQYAIQTGQHPAVTTKENIDRYRKQLDKIGFSFDWDREVQTSDPKYYKWTQWIFIQLFNAWYNPRSNKAEHIDTLINIFETEGSAKIIADSLSFGEGWGEAFTPADWKTFDEKKRSDILMKFRLAYLGEAYVNWCPALGTVLANDEVKDGVSERGGYPVERKLMKQWSMRITCYAQRLLDGLNKIDWTESLKESQRNWIGRSEGTSLKFSLIPNPSPKEKGAKQFWQTADPTIYEALKNFARANRQPQTEAEEKLWESVRNNKLGNKFRRQHAIATYIADFICIEKKLIIEVDGEIHLTTKENDDKRTAVLNQLGYTVIRFTNQEVLNEHNTVLQKIKSVIESIPSLLERGQGGEAEIEVFTTRPDTIFGVSFVTLAPEHELVEKITTAEHKRAVDEYVTYAKNRSERERQADVKNVSGQFTGAYVMHPFTGKQIPIYVGDYVLAGYGTGAVMAVPGHDERDHRFAKHFGLPILKVVDGPDVDEASNDAKEGKCINSDFLNGLEVKDAIKKAIAEIEKKEIGTGKINYRLRDAVFGRQRYWGEPIPIYYKDGIPYPLPENKLPLVLPEVDKFLPTETGEPPLARATDWKYEGKYEYEQTTMPGWAGSSWYFLRYMDANNSTEFVSKQAAEYWQNIDLYLGGSEHATGHLLYVRFWTMFLKDMGYITFDEPAKKLINQGMIQGMSSFVYRLTFVVKDEKDQEIILKVFQVTRAVPVFISKKRHDNLFDQYGYDWADNITDQEILSRQDEVRGIVYEHVPEFKGSIRIGGISKINVDILHVNNNILDTDAFTKWREEYQLSKFLLEENGQYICGSEVEKMSKSKYNVVTPDLVCDQYGADCLRLYEMFLGPLEQHKPWNTNGITGVSGFLKKLWKLFHNNPTSNFELSTSNPEKPELKSLHKTIKKITDDIDRFSFNTSVSNFMICVNELTDLKCNKKAILEPLVILIAPYAPHICEELWKLMGHTESITYAKWPEYIAEHTVDNSFEYPVSFNGKTRFKMELPLSLGVPEIEKEVLSRDEVKKLLDGKSPKKVIIVHNKIVNIVV